MTQPIPAERPPSVWEDLLEIFYAPTAVFERRRDTPAFGLALLIFTVALVGLFFAFKGVMQPLLDAEFQRGMAQAVKQNPGLTPERIEGIRAATAKFAVIGLSLYGLVAPLLLGVLLWFVGKLLESTAEIGQVLMVTTYAMFPKLLEAITNAIQILVLPEGSITSRFSVNLGVARFLNPDQVSQVVMVVAGRLDVFSIWVTVIQAIGLSVMGKIPRGRAALAAATVWFLAGIPAIIGALRSGS